MDIELPQRYHNSRAGHAKWLLISLVASVVMLVTNYFDWTAIDGWLVAAPVLLIAARTYLYGLLVNAIHEGIRIADMDDAIDSAEVAIFQQQAAQQAAFASKILTADHFNDVLRG